MTAPVVLERVLDPVTLADTVRYAGASGDFNPLHYDPELARRLGFPTAIAHGMLLAGLMATAVTELFGPASVRRFATRFRSTLEVGAAPRLQVRAEPPDAAGLVVVTAELSHAGRVVATAEATVAPDAQTWAPPATTSTSPVT